MQDFYDPNPRDGSVSIAQGVESKIGDLNIGVIASVRGSVVDARFDDRLPVVHTMLRTGAARQILIEVLEQRDARHVRGIALTPTQGLARGMDVEDTGHRCAPPSAAGFCRACSMSSVIPSIEERPCST